MRSRRRSAPGPGAWRMVKAGMLSVAGGVPVVKSRGNGEACSPSPPTWTISYVVLASIPATRKFRLRPRSQGSALVRVHGASGDRCAGRNRTWTLPSWQGGAL